jgi:hypothetical protein
MKRSSLLSLAALAIVVPTAVAMWALIPLEVLLKHTDVIVVARLSEVSKTTRNRVDYGSGTLTVTEILRGKAKAGDKLRLEWSNHSDIVCPRVEHEPYNGQTMIWLLQTSSNGTVRADYPGRVLNIKKRAELNKLLKK